jgi:hypothetical protein
VLASDGGWPSGFAVQAGSSNHRKLRRSRAGVVSVAGKGLLSAGRVGDEKTNMCEPLLMHRKTERRLRRRVEVSGQGRALRGAVSQGAACVLPWRCPVQRWRELVAGAGRETQARLEGTRSATERVRMPSLGEATVNRSLPDQALDGFVEELASRIAGFDSQAISESKALIDSETLPDNQQLLAPYQAFFGSVARLVS